MGGRTPVIQIQMRRAVASPTLASNTDHLLFNGGRPTFTARHSGRITTTPATGDTEDEHHTMALHRSAV